MNNPFENLDTRLTSLESKLDRLLMQQPRLTSGPEVGGMELAQEITRLSKPRVYALVSEGRLPNSKRGNKLYFNRADLLAWVNAGKRGENETAANA